MFEGCVSCFKLVGNVRCEACTDNYVLSGGFCCPIEENVFPFSGGCERCEVLIYGCASCVYENGLTTCIACEEGFDLVNSLLCQSDPLCPDGCLSCEEDAFGQVICLECY